METITYKPHTERMLEIDALPITVEQKWNLGINGVHFDKRTPQIGDFIPCIDGEPVLEPTPDDYKSIPWNETGICKAYEIDLSAYQSACDRVIFEGFEVSEALNICNVEKDVYVAYYNMRGRIWIWNFNTLSDLSNFNLTLTAYGQKLLQNGE